MNRVCSVFDRSLLGGAFVVVLGLGGAAAAQVGPDVADPWSEARALYAAEDYANALPYAVEAVQREPDRAEVYLGIARILFWMERYDEAVFYYDIYLVDLADNLGPSVPARNRVDVVRQERDAANGARRDPSAAPSRSSGVEAARSGLVSRLDSGPVLTPTGGGSWSMYEGLLRSGYADPDLTDLRARLADALLAEAQGAVNGRVAAMPALPYDQWLTQRQRWVLWQQLTGPAAPAQGTALPSTIDPAIAATLARPGGDVAAQIALCDGQLAYLNMAYETALDAFTAAVTASPELLPAHLGRLNTLHRLGDAPASDIDAALNAFAAAVQDPDDGVVALYRAVFAADAGRSAEAVEAMIGLLAP